MQVTIAPIAREHIESFHRCLDTVARERRYLALVEAPPLEETRKFVESNIANSHIQLVALVDGEVVGWCDILPRRMPMFGHCGELGIGVLPGFRGRGIGKRLATEALRLAREKGFERVELGVFASNVAARALYERLGFVVEGVKRRARKLDGEYDDVVLMALFL